METNKVFSKVFMWMAVGLFLTFGTGYYLSTQPDMMINLFGSSFLITIILVQLVVAIGLGFLIRKMSYSVALVFFLIYSFLTGITFSTIFIAYQLESIISIFLVTAIVFGLFAIIGSRTKIDLTKFSSLFFMALIGLLVATLVNMFFRNEIMDIIISWVGLLIFIGVTAYDIQNIRKMTELMNGDKKVQIIGAFTLYLDFINIFVRLLRLFGKSK